MSAAARARDLRKGWCPGALRPMQTGDGWLVRLRITGGIVPAPAGPRHRRLRPRLRQRPVDLSGRANLQLRGVRDDTLRPAGAALAALGLLDDAPAAESVRNVIASPLAGLDAARCSTSARWPPRSSAR